MLHEKDRIFTNLYGHRDRSIKGAIQRGAWTNTKKILVKGSDWIVEEIKPKSVLLLHWDTKMLGFFLMMMIFAILS